MAECQGVAVLGARPLLLAACFICVFFFFFFWQFFSVVSTRSYKSCCTGDWASLPAKPCSVSFCQKRKLHNGSKTFLIKAASLFAPLASSLEAILIFSRFFCLGVLPSRFDRFFRQDKCSGRWLLLLRFAWQSLTVEQLIPVHSFRW